MTQTSKLRIIKEDQRRYLPNNGIQIFYFDEGSRVEEEQKHVYKHN